ncbi:MAG: pilus assembly protein PilM [Deltaproteobacteria bacterium]|nr:MAG: pilus assembly protein PilM [Deltaproteobacteria bacterium]
MPVYIPGCQIVGLDIGSKAIKALQLTTSSNDYKITGFLVKERRGSTWEGLVEDLRSLTGEEVLQSDVLVVSFPSHHVLFRNTDMPFTQLSKIEATVPYEAESIMISPLEEMVVDFALLEQTPQGSSVLITCVEKELLQDYMDALHEGGTVPDAVIIDSLALARLMEELKEDKTIGLLDIGTRKISIGIFEEEKLRVTRSIPMGGGGEEFRSALEEAIFTVKSYQGEGQTPIEEIWLAGGNSRVKGLGGYLERELKIKAHYPHFLEEFPSTVTLPEEANLLGGVAMGLALRGLRREKGSVDLARKLPAPPLTFAPLLRKRAVNIAVGLIVLLVLIGVSFYVGVSAKERRYTMLKGEIRRVFKEAFPEVKGIVNELQQAKELVRGMGERGVKIRSYGAQSPLDVVREIALRLPRGAKIVELDMDEGRISLRGIASSFSLVDEVKKSFMASRLFQDVKLGNVELSRRGGQGVIFRMVLEREGKRPE